MKLKKRATIFVPKVASRSKMDRIRSYGAELIVTGEHYSDALAESERWQQQSGAIAIHAYDQIETLLGQGTVGLEIEEEAPNLDTLVIAVGGGGLIGGIAAWYQNRIKIIAIEPDSAPTLHRALEAGEPVDAPAGGVAADSLAPKRVGTIMFPIAKKYVHQSLLVTDDAIIHAQKELWEKARIAAEPGGAAALSALLSGKYIPEKGERVGVVICGGNTTAVQL
jgi:threonine dehydratase